MSHDVFISYSSIDKDVADNVCAKLEAKGISCWIAPRDIMPGKAFSEAIIDGIQKSKVFVLVYSSNSNHSAQVIREVDRAVHNGLAIITLRLEDVPLSKQLEYYVSSVHWLDAITPPAAAHMNQLCDVVQMFLKPDEIRDIEIARALGEGILKQEEPSWINKISGRLKKKTILFSGIIIASVIIIGSLIFFGNGGTNKAGTESIESIVILPFDNFTGDKNLDYVAAGMHSSLIGDIGRLGALRVIGKTSSSAFINTNKSATDIARELNIDAIVEPTLTSFSDTVCIQIRVITPFPEEKQIWVGDYIEEKSKILNLYNRITKQIANELMIEISPEEELLLSKSRVVDKDAYDIYLKGYYFLNDFGKESLVTARSYLQEAIEKDSTWAPLYLGMSSVWLTMANMGFESIELAFSETYRNLEKALSLDPDLPEVHFMLAALASSAEWNWEKAEKEYLRTLAINPNDALARMQYSLLLFALQRPGEGMAQAQLGYELDPLNLMIQTLYGTAIACSGDCETALSALERVTNSDPNHYMANNVIVGSSYMCGDFNRMFETDIKILPFDSIAIAEVDRIYNDHGFVAAYNEINRKMEKFAEDNPVIPADMAWRYYVANQYDKALDWLERAFEEHDGNLMLITTKYVNFNRLYDKPRFTNIVKKLNLPLPEGY